MPLFGPAIDSLRKHVLRVWKARALKAEAELDDCRTLVIEVAMGVTHSPSCARLMGTDGELCMRCVAEDAQAKLKALVVALDRPETRVLHANDCCRQAYSAGRDDLAGEIAEATK